MNSSRVGGSIFSLGLLCFGGGGGVSTEDALGGTSIVGGVSIAGTITS